MPGVMPVTKCKINAQQLSKTDIYEKEYSYQLKVLFGFFCFLIILHCTEDSTYSHYG